MVEHKSWCSYCRSRSKARLESPTCFRSGGAQTREAITTGVQSPVNALADISTSHAVSQRVIVISVSSSFYGMCHHRLFFDLIRYLKLLKYREDDDRWSLGSNARLAILYTTSFCDSTLCGNRSTYWDVGSPLSRLRTSINTFFFLEI